MVVVVVVAVVVMVVMVVVGKYSGVCVAVATLQNVSVGVQWQHLCGQSALKVVVSTRK